MNSNSRDSLIKALQEISVCLWQIESKGKLERQIFNDASKVIDEAISHLQSDETIP